MSFFLLPRSFTYQQMRYDSGLQRPTTSRKTLVIEINIRSESDAVPGNPNFALNVEPRGKNGREMAHVRN